MYIESLLILCILNLPGCHLSYLDITYWENKPFCIKILWIGYIIGNMASTVVFGFFNNEMEIADETTCVITSSSKERSILFSIIDDIYEFFDRIVLHSDDVSDLPVLLDIRGLLEERNKWYVFFKICWPCLNVQILKRRKICPQTQGFIMLPGCLMYYNP